MKLNVFALIALVGMLGLTSCNKEKQQEKKIVGTWNIQTAMYTVGETTVDLFAESEEEITLNYKFVDDNQFEIEYTETPTEGEPTVENLRGTWDILDEQLILDYEGSEALLNAGETSETYEIVELKKSDLKLKFANTELTVDLTATK